MIEGIQNTTTLHNGVKMPWVGLGTWDQGPQITNTVKFAIKTGYLSIDTGSFYQNEEGVGKGIQESGIPRENLFITTKVWNSEQGYEATLKSFEISMQKLGLAYIDLFLVHWPVKGKSKETWRALEKLYKEGRIRAIGVSNFEIHHIEDLLTVAEVKPMVNQIELHPLMSCVELREYCKKQGIQVEAWAPLAQGKLFENAMLKELAGKYNKSVSQIILRWHLQNEVVTIPKSNNESRIIENGSIFDFELTTEDMEKINALNENHRLLGFDPDSIPSNLLESPVPHWEYSL